MDIEPIITSISKLSNQERRQLLRRLRVSGLLDDDELMTDQNRLVIAPALGLQQHNEKDLAEAEEPSLEPHSPVLPPAAPSTSVLTDARFVAPEKVSAPENASAPNVFELTPQSEANAGHGVPDDGDAAYHSPISGRVVVGSPEDAANVDDDPHLMPPLPGQAPEQPIGIVFDGGSKGNPGRGYGSYAVDWPGLPQQIVKLQFGNHVTNNEAEYDTLIAALEAMVQRLHDQGADPSTASIEMRGDSQLVVYQVLGQWKCKDARMKVRRDRVRQLLENFATWRINHHDRSNSVRVLGH